MNVVDLGCKDWWTETSVSKLVERFQPERLYGFDPHPSTTDKQWTEGNTVVTVARAAAWTFDGTIPFLPDTTGSRVLADPAADGAVLVQCFDLATYLHGMPEPVVLKLDVEGAEHILIPHLTRTGEWPKVALLLVEFHGDAEPPEIPVPWEPWV